MKPEWSWIAIRQADSVTAVVQDVAMEFDRHKALESVAPRHRAWQAFLTSARRLKLTTTDL
jgi:hypothetical protein